MKPYMFDSTTFSHLVGDGPVLNRLRDRGRYFVTHIQHDEIGRAFDPERRELLARMFELVAFESDATKGSEAIQENLNRRKRTRHNVHDAIIAETCVEKKITLVTDNEALAQLVQELGGTSVGIGELLQGS